mmetsp:Transcript_47667/g.113463  ORF Transcript_47667/g.113463 Transcript_47667/m.113463 type:complete len:222 (-) Transcript_47667:1188-1853(-)
MILRFASSRLRASAKFLPFVSSRERVSARCLAFPSTFLSSSVRESAELFACASSRPRACLPVASSSPAVISRSFPCRALMLMSEIRCCASAFKSASSLASLAPASCFRASSTSWRSVRRPSSASLCTCTVRCSAVLRRILRVASVSSMYDTNLEFFSASVSLWAIRSWRPSMSVCCSCASSAWRTRSCSFSPRSSSTSRRRRCSSTSFSAAAAAASSSAYS